jgi:flavorubredoxin
MKITDTIHYVGVNDHKLDLFEGQYEVENGMAYNSYVILDEKIAVMDSVEGGFGKEWLGNIKAEIGDRTPDYLIVQHAEPDHSSSIKAFLECWPEAEVVSSAQAFNMIKQLFDVNPVNRKLVKDGDTLSLGAHELTFVGAPMVHWPEVIMTYDQTDRVLFSADAFGKFGALDVEEDDWACEARRYYFGIVGRFGVQVQAVLKKLAKYDVQTICPLHGPVLNENLGYYLDLYNTWSSYGVESEGVAICYTSVYGNTEKAVRLLEAELLKQGCPKVAVSDLARCDMAEAVEDAFRYGKLVLATTTYDGDIFPYMKEFINKLTQHNYQNRTIGLIENGTWGPLAAKIMKGMFEKSKNITFTETTVTIRSALNEASTAQLEALAKELL